MKDYEAPEENSDRIVDFFFTGRKQQVFWFWFVGICMVIPVLTFISSTLVSLLAGLVFALLGVSTDFSKPTALVIIALCVTLCSIGYYKLWEQFREKRNKN